MVSCPLWVFMFMLVPIYFPLRSQLSISRVNCLEANNNTTPDGAPTVEPLSLNIVLPLDRSASSCLQSTNNTNSEHTRMG